MKKRQKKRYTRGYVRAKKRRKNKALCERYPFLIPRNVWSDEIIWNRPGEQKYAYTLADDFPPGWWKAFGRMLCEELREDLIACNYLNEFRVEQIKEKFGQLRMYFNNVPIESKASEIIDKYSYISENVCIKCGEVDVYMLNMNGWLSPYCFSCFEKIKRRTARYYHKHITESEIYESFDKAKTGDNRMVDDYTIHRFEKQPEVIDISSTTNKVRKANSDRFMASCFDRYRKWM